DTQAHHQLDDAPDDQAGDEHPGEDAGHTQQLRAEGGVSVGGRHDQAAPDADHAVYRDGTDRIVDPQAVQGQDAEHHQHTAHGTDQHGLFSGGCQRLGGDGHQASQGAVEDHGQVGLAEQRTGG